MTLQVRIHLENRIRLQAIEHHAIVNVNLFHWVKVDDFLIVLNYPFFDEYQIQHVRNHQCRLIMKILGIYESSWISSDKKKSLLSYFFSFAKRKQ